MIFVFSVKLLYAKKLFGLNNNWPFIHSFGLYCQLSWFCRVWSWVVDRLYIH